MKVSGIAGFFIRFDPEKRNQIGKYRVLPPGKGISETSLSWNTHAGLHMI
jgi:hypothetical protein